jgi:acyl-CoA thioester hydrolase
MMTAASEIQTTVEGGTQERVPVYYDDLDAMGIVHNARYAVLLERALDAFWRRHGYTFDNGAFSKPDLCLAVVEFSIAYRTPIRGTGSVDVDLWLDRLGSSSATYAFRVQSVDSTATHAEGRRVHVRLDPETTRPTAWTPPCREIFETLLRTPTT